MARLGLINAELELVSAVDDYDHQILRKRMRDNPHFNAFNYLNDKEFFDTYRLSKTLASMVVHELEPHLPSIRSTSVSVVAKVSDSNLKILSIDASYGGASHDSYIWEHHPLRQHVEDMQQTESAWFLVACDEHFR